MKRFEFSLVVLTLAAPLLSQSSADTSARAWVLLAAFELIAGAVLLVRRRYPATAFLVVMGSLVSVFVIGAAIEAKLSPLAFLPLAVALYSLGDHCADWVRTVLAAVGGGLIVALGIWINHATTDRAELRGGSDVLGVLAPMPLAWAAGFAARTHRANVAASQQRVDDVLRQQWLREQQAAQRERVRIAREMHDVVAHSLTLLIVQTEMLRARDDALPEWARSQVDGLAVAGRQASAELRDLLQVLRDPDDAAPLTPLPALADLPTLLDRSRAAGSTVTAEQDADLDSLPRPVQLAVYRIVQEALTNARRYAPDAPVRVILACDGPAFRCEVVNDRSAAAGMVGIGTGLGLVSMRERVDALGGDLEVGPTSDGGFRVRATLPMTAGGRL